MAVSRRTGVFIGIPGVFLSWQRRAGRVLDDFGQQDADEPGIWICKPDSLWKGRKSSSFFDEAFIWGILCSWCCGGVFVNGRILMYRSHKRVYLFAKGLESVLK